VSAYYVSLTLADVPIQILCTMIYIFITYFLTGQPLELFRFMGFFVINLLVTLVAQGVGHLCGSIFNVTLGAIVGPFFICPFLIFSGFFVQLKHAHALLHWLFHISFLKYGLEGGVYAILGFDRERLVCDANESELFYCHYQVPKTFIRDIGMMECRSGGGGGNSTDSASDCDWSLSDQKFEFWKVIGILIGFIFVFRTAAFHIMRYRLKN